MNTRLAHLPAEVARRALTLGAAKAVILTAGAVSIEDELAAFCHTPRCPAFGRSRNCPPYSIRPDQLRRRIGRFAHALVFKIDVPACRLLTEAILREPAVAYVPWWPWSPLSRLLKWLPLRWVVKLF